MPQVKYIGTTPKTDSIDGIGLPWEPGQARSVSAEVAERLSAYPDTWTTVASPAPASSEPIHLAPPVKEVEEPLPVIDFHAMDKDAMIDYAERHYGERLDRRLSKENIRHRLIGLFTRREMEQD